MKIPNTLKSVAAAGLLLCAALPSNTVQAEWDTAYWSDNYVDYLSAYEDYIAHSDFPWAYNYYYLGEAVPYWHWYTAGWTMDYHARNGPRGYIAYNRTAFDTFNYYADIGDYYWLTYF